MPAKKPSPARPARSRTATKEQFEAIKEERESIEATDSKSAEAVHARSNFVRSAVHGMTVEGVIKAAADLKLAASNSLDDVTSKLAAKVEELRLTEEAVELGKADLKALHEIDVAATSIGILIEEHNEKASELNTVALIAREAWEAESKTHFEDNRRRDQDLILARKREAEEFEYKKATERRQKEDEWAQALLTRQRAERDRIDVLEGNWRVRETKLADEEASVATLREQVATFDARMAKERDTAVAIATNALKKDLTQAFALQQKDMETQLLIERSKVAQAEGNSQKQEAVVAQLQARITELQKQVVDTASKAIDGAAKQDAFNQFAQMQRENGALSVTKRPG